MRINKYPFFLWLTQKRDDFKLDLQNQRIYSDELGSSSIKAVPVYWIILMKYVPVLLLVYHFYFPQNQQDLLILCASSFFVGLFFILFRFPLFFQLFVILFCVINFFLIFTFDNYVSFLSTGLTFFMEISLIGAVLYDIFVSKGYKNWYFLETFKREINLSLRGKKERKFLFFKKKVGLEGSKKFNIKGYFLRISK